MPRPGHVFTFPLLLLSANRKLPTMKSHPMRAAAGPMRITEQFSVAGSCMRGLQRHCISFVGPFLPVLKSCGPQLSQRRWRWDRWLVHGSYGLTRFSGDPRPRSSASSIAGSPIPPFSARRAPLTRMQVQPIYQRWFDGRHQAFNDLALARALFCDHCGQKAIPLKLDFAVHARFQPVAKRIGGR